MIYVRITTEDGLILDTAPAHLNTPINSKKDKVFRHVVVSGYGSVEFLFENEPRIVNSNKVLNAFTKSYVLTLDSILNSNLKKGKEIADDYLHNFKKIHGNQKSIIERCVSASEKNEKYSEFTNAVEKNLLSAPHHYAEDICALSKEIRLVDYHIGAYNLLQDPNLIVSITHNHNLKKFLLGLSHLFFDSFSKIGINFSLHNLSENYACSFEYETFNMAMHSFLENILKYAKPYSKVQVELTESEGKLSFTMDSVRIEKDEVEKIFERGYSGRNVPSSLRGKGIGMYLLKKALDRSKIQVEIKSDYSSCTEVGGTKYQKNIFTFSF